MEKTVLEDKSIHNLIEVFISGDDNNLNISNNYKKVIYSYDHINKKYTFFSEGLKDLIGYSLDELNKIGFSSIVQKVVKPKYNQLNNIPNKNPNELFEDFSAQYLIKTKSGDLKWLEDISIFTEDSKGVPKSSIGILSDITDIQSLIEELKEEKNRLNEVLDLANIIFMVIDGNNTIKLINQYGCKVLGYSKDELLNSSIEKLFSKNEYKEASLRTKKIFSKESEAEYENVSVVITKNNTEKIIRWNNNVVKNEDGSVKYIISSGEEITDRIKDERVQRIISDILDKSNSEVNLDDLFNFIHQSISELMPVNNFYIALNDVENGLISFPYFVDEVDEEAPPQKLAKGLTEYILRQGKSALIDKKLDAELVKKGEVEIIGTQAEIWLGSSFENSG